ncbi:MAG: hypothetical protein JO101_02835, partial [Candidatus Eremiobacteraeota bacterium]|nr:hypothetical protein [Candidatus Eremiobacteraeota bacterium]
MSTAAQQFWNRNYQDAIASYQQAGTLIYQFLDPNTPVDVVGVYPQLSKNAALFGPLLSISAQYMNALPTVGSAPLAPLTPPDPTLLGNPSFDGSGIRLRAASAQVASASPAVTAKVPV